MRYQKYTFWVLPVLILSYILTACGPTVTQIQAQQTITINPTFQSQISPIPTVPAYRCGAWASNNAPFPNDTIIIYAKLTNQDLTGVGGATAVAVVHFRDGDQTLDQQTSDNGGYVMFTLALQGHQPTGVPTTVDVTFSNFPGGTLRCTPAFFTPQ